jgi:F420-dependent oxidoreductase-like protein
MPIFDRDPARIGQVISEVATHAEAAGFDTFWVMDHFYQLPVAGGPDEPMLEAYTALGFVAGVTSRIRLGTLVTGAHYRAPGLLAKAVTTLDVVSGGRAWLGLGAGWYERESVGLGFGMPSTSHRFDDLEDALGLITRMWSGDRTAFSGHHVEAVEPISNPQPVTRPRPPIMIGGGGERKTLRLVARYADACNLFSATGRADLTRKLEVLDAHCADVGRDPSEIERTVFVTPGTDDEAVAELVEMGFGHLIFPVATPDDVDSAIPRVPGGLG